MRSIVEALDQLRRLVEGEGLEACRCGIDGDCPLHPLGNGHAGGPTPYHPGAESSWAALRKDLRSPHVGWSAAGEFHCPYCDTSIGKNLKGDKPFLLATQHLKKAHQKTPADMAKFRPA